jgi:hypothetical protein
MEDNSKIISISGIHNKRQIKNLNSEPGAMKMAKKRVQSEKWSFSNDNFEYLNQMQMVKNIFNNEFHHTANDDVSKIAIQEINKKISGYKQQDRIKKRYDESQFLTLESVILKMVECELKCRYCRGEMDVIYDISRESRQWSVDRINNDLGHNLTNFHLACLECNLKRRRRTDEKFLFTKQLNIIKKMQ